MAHLQFQVSQRVPSSLETCCPYSPPKPSSGDIPRGSWKNERGFVYFVLLHLLTLPSTSDRAELSPLAPTDGCPLATARSFGALLQGRELALWPSLKGRDQRSKLHLGPLQFINNSKNGQYESSAYHMPGFGFNLLYAIYCSIHIPIMG